ncbi:HpcH/HpaI aldolase/citrate lyase family protein [Aureimonas sp. AU40]|uniref:HpcH/HpaI aldolase/citrate lyase family protein n=1 Tax=Aureimonas sp. AU40 TaxID=1637747 RepID=UPI0007815D17|nr:aldolase/citrate lyase family protein [Aureimonas sp. AU40]
MPSAVEAATLFLFVPADRPERFAKAFAAGADAVILDLEDAVALEAKGLARVALREAASSLAQAPCPVLVRLNAAGSREHEADLALAAALPLSAVMLAKSERAEEVATVAATSGHPVVALVESAAGLANVRALAQVSARLAFGSFDFAADLGCRHTREALLLARLELVLASRLAGRPAPVDGVTASTRDEAAIEADAAHAAALGFAAKLLIHPAQIASAARGFAPAEGEIAWAERAIAAGQGGGAVALDGEMVDAPVLLRAKAILRAARRITDKAITGKASA